MWRRRDPAEAQLVVECEAFLTGALAETAEQLGGPVPVWAWMNLLAHGSAADLREASESLPGRLDWRQARGYLAGEVLDLVDTGQVTLASLQRDVLAPLELEVASQPRAQRLTPSGLVTIVLAALPQRSRRRERR